MTRIIAAILYVFLLMMQQEAVDHGLHHLRAELSQAHERSASLPVDTPCDECALLAAAANALSGSAHDIAVPLAAALEVFPLPGRPRFQAQRYYAARAPPPFS